MTAGGAIARAHVSAVAGHCGWRPLPPRQGHSEPANLSMHTTCPTRHAVRRRCEALVQKKKPMTASTRQMVKYYPNGQGKYVHPESVNSRTDCYTGSSRMPTVIDGTRTQPGGNVPPCVMLRPASWVQSGMTDIACISSFVPYRELPLSHSAKGPPC